MIYCDIFFIQDSHETCGPQNETTATKNVFASARDASISQKRSS